MRRLVAKDSLLLRRSACSGAMSSVPKSGGSLPQVRQRRADAADLDAGVGELGGHRHGHAADLPVKAKAVECVRVCSLYGAEGGTDRFPLKRPRKLPMFAAMSSRLYACRLDGRYAYSLQPRRAPCLRTSSAICSAMKVARLPSGRDRYIWTFLARSLKPLESQQASILQEWRRRGYGLHYRADDSRLRRVPRSKYPYSREA
jgi:hypothetical protein